MSEAYRNATTSPRTLAEAAQLVATALDWIPRGDLEVNCFSLFFLEIVRWEYLKE
jgi:hypothetical protein